MDTVMVESWSRRSEKTGAPSNRGFEGWTYIPRRNAPSSRYRVHTYGPNRHAYGHHRQYQTADWCKHHQGQYSVVNLSHSGSIRCLRIRVAYDRAALDGACTAQHSHSPRVSNLSTRKDTVSTLAKIILTATSSNRLTAVCKLFQNT